MPSYCYFVSLLSDNVTVLGELDKNEHIGQRTIKKMAHRALHAISFSARVINGMERAYKRSVKRLFIAFGFAFVLAAQSPAAERPSVIIKSHPAHPTRILAKQRENIKASASAASLSDLNLTVREHLSLVPGLVVLDQGSGPVRKNLEDRASLLAQRIEALRKTGLYEYVEPDYLVRASVIPSDSRFTDGTLWGLRNTGQSGGVGGADIGAVTAWDLTVGSTNVIVAIVDSGIRYTHNDLAQQMWRNPTEIPGNGVDDDKDGYIDNVFGINAITGSGDPFDDGGHGTHMAGIIGAAANDGNPIVGVAWKVRLMACKFLAEDGFGTTSDAIRSINFAVQKGAKIINNSWGGDSYSQALFDAVAAGRDRGVLFLAAAGNDGINNDVFPTYPANFNIDNILAVAALDRADKLPDFANFGLRSVHLGAPGVAIYSSGKESDTDYFLASGSSPATAYISGVAALILARFPEIGVGELRTRLIETAVPIEALTGKTVTGGRVNAFGALNTQADGNLEIGVSAAEGAPLIAGRTAVIFVRVTDLSSVMNATVSGSGSGLASLVFRNDGLSPDAKAEDSVYSAAVSVPANVTDLSLTITASAPGKNAATQTITFPVISPPLNDNFEAATSLNGTVVNVTANNRGASKETGEQNHADETGGKSLWWKWTAPSGGTVMIDTDGSDFDTLLAVYTGGLLSNLTHMASNDDDGDSGASVVTFEAVAGTVYKIAVDGFAGQTGNIELNLNLQSGSAPGNPAKYVFTTLAGLPGTNGSADGTGSIARFNHPTKAALDSAGNLYVSDADNHTIRKITPGAVVSTFAGLAGSAGGTDGATSAARFRSPVGLVVDGGGNIYVSDTYNHTIRKITPDGTVSTLAGSAGITGSTDGIGSAARFHFPRGGAVDSANNFYFADQNNHTIRKVTPGGMVSTLAGLAGTAGSANGTRSAARFNFPGGVVVDGRGNIYVADGFNNTVRKITPGGVVTTVAGLAGTSGSVDGTGSAARFKYPTDVAVDLTGNIFVLEYENHTLRMISPNGVVTTVAGLAGSSGSADGVGGSARFNQPVGITVDSAGVLYVADTYNHTIRKGIPGDSLTNFPPFISAIADQAAPLGTPVGPISFTVIDFQTPPANLVVTPTSTNPVLLPNSNIGLGGTGANRTVTLTPAANQSGTTLIELLVSNGSLSNKTSFALTIYEPYTFITMAGSAGKQGSADGGGNIARFNTPVGIARDSAGSIYVTDTINSTIRKIMLDGAVSTMAGRPGTIGSTDGTGDAARFHYPIGLVVNSAGVFYVSDTYNQTIRKITASGVVSTLAGSAGSIGSVDGTGGAARFFYPRGAAVDSSDNLYVADQNNHTIRKITSGGVVSVWAGSAKQSGSADGIGSEARFNHPASVSIDAANNIYVADGFNNTIRKITPSGAVTTIAGLAGTRGSVDGRGSAARFNYPVDAAVDSAGNVYVTEFENHTVRRITPEGTVITVAGLAGSIGSADGTGSTARFHHPDGVVVDGAGNIYVTDQGNHTIRKGVPASIARPPIISAQPESRSVSSGASVSFQVAATGSTPLSYQWFFSAAEAMPPFGLIASWSGNGHASDDQGRFIGVLTNGVGFSAGKVGQGFRLDGITAGVVVPDAPGLNFSQGADLSIETWIHAESGARDFIMVIVDKRISPEISSAVGYALSLWEGRLSFQLSDAPLRPSNFSNYHASRDLRDGLFHHIAVTVDRDQPDGGKMYVDGKAVLTFDPTTRPGDLSNAGPLRIGHNSDPNFNSFFKGVIDEVRLYGRALSAAEIEAVFNAGTDLAGATSSTLTLGNVQLQHAGNYAVRVSNAFGTVTSAPATLTVVAGNAPPTISLIADQTTTVNVPTSPIPFTIGDAETAAENLIIIVTSSNTALLPNQNIFLTGAGANRTLQLYPEIGQAGSANITVTVKDGGQATASRQFALTVTPAPRKVTIAAAADTSLLENNPDNNLGGAEEITAGTSAQGKKSRGLLKFDISAHIPANATITLALLKASVVNAPTNLAETTFGLYRILREWGEGTKTGSSGQPATANEATWNHRRTSSEAWGAPGGMAATDYVAESSALTSTVAGPGGYYFNTSPGLIADVQAWVSNPSTNFGWMVIGQSEATVRTERRFGSREASNDPPRLIVEFTLPAGANAPPTISQIPDQIIPAGATTAPLPFIIGDSETPAAQLTLAAASSNEALFPSANIVLGGSGTNRTVTITPAPAQTGSETISITVTDGNSLSATRTFRVTVVPAGAEFLVGSARGTNGTVLVVPVRVRSFANIVNFQFSMHWNPAVVRFDKVEQFGLPSMAEANFGATDAANGTLRVSWDDATSQSVANDTVIFALRFEVLGNAGTTSSVTIDGVPTLMEITGPGLKPVPLLPHGGEVVVGPPQLRVAGRVRYYTGDKSVSGVALDVSGDALSRITSGGDGTFNFTLEAGGNYTLRPNKTEGDSAAQGVTTTDITFIRRHILAIQDLDSPYAVLAGDVNDSGSVTTSDITFIRRVILGIDQSLPGGLWKFVRADQQFSDPRQPWNHDKTRSVAGLSGELTGLDFIAMKLGDVNASWNPPADAGLLTVAPSGATETNASRPGIVGSKMSELDGVSPHLKAQSETGTSVAFRVGAALRVDGSEVEVPVSVSRFSHVTSVQFSLEWDPAAWELTEIGRFGLPRLGEENFGRALAGHGKLTFSWDDPAGYGVTLPDGEEVFRLSFTPKATGAPLSAHFGDEPTLREVTVNGSPVLWRTEDERGGLASGDMPLKIESTIQNGERRIRLIIPTVPGRNYILEFTDALPPAEWRELERIAGDGAEHVLIDEAAAESQRFYRVRTW
jgi:subtilisin family serine protease